jgi:hypothetical protein
MTTCAMSKDSVDILLFIRLPRSRISGICIFQSRTFVDFRWVTYVHTRYILVHKAHQKNPIVRIGPNSLSFGDARAVQDILGHGTPVTKEDFYKVVAGTHRHVADVQDK